MRKNNFVLIEIISSEGALKFRNSIASHPTNALNFLITFHGVSYGIFYIIVPPKTMNKLQK